MDYRQRLIETALELERLGLATVGPGKGSCSVRDFETGNLYITPSGKGFSSLSPGELAEAAPDGTVLRGAKASVDLLFHRAIYQARPEVGAVIHLHSPYAAAFAVLRQPIPLAMQAAANVVGAPIPVAEFALPGTPALGGNIVKAMGGTLGAVLMANHGMVACAPTPEECLVVASTVETAAKVTFIAMQMGAPVILTPEQAEGARGFYAQKFLKN